MIQRNCKLSNKHSFFLFGPRGTGKTTLLQSLFAEKESLIIDLLDNEIMDQFLIDSKRFEAMITEPQNLKKRVIVDEVQKFPKLLDVVQKHIQKHKRQFILTGSSSRRLKQQGSNLLAGRAWVYHLYPFTSFELRQDFDLKKALECGTLPDAFLPETKEEVREYLNAYVGTYLQKEIQQEQWVKNLEPFRRFLAIAAQMNGKIINKSNMARDIGVHDTTIANYFQILEDTLLGFLLPAFDTSLRKAQKQAPKFYFIDPGIKRALDRTLTIELLPQTTAWGDAFEHWVILEIIKNANYQRLDWDFSYIRTQNDVEIDLIVNRPGSKKLLIEIKSKEKVLEQDAKSLESLGKDIPHSEKYLLSCDPLEQKFGSTRALHWQKALKEWFE